MIPMVLLEVETMDLQAPLALIPMAHQMTLMVLQTVLAALATIRLAPAIPQADWVAVLTARPVALVTIAMVHQVAPGMNTVHPDEAVTTVTARPVALVMIATVHQGEAVTIAMGLPVILVLEGVAMSTLVALAMVLEPLAELVMVIKNPAATVHRRMVSTECHSITYLL